MPRAHDVPNVLDVLELRIAEETYALPLARVAEVSLRLPIHAVPELAPPLLGFVSYRSNAVLAVDMRQRLGYPARRPRLWDHFVLARTARRLVVLVVDRVLGLSLVERSSVQASPASAAHVAGVVPVHGGLLFIADLDAVLSLEEERAVDALLRSGAFAE